MSNPQRFSAEHISTESFVPSDGIRQTDPPPQSQFHFRSAPSLNKCHFRVKWDKKIAHNKENYWDSSGYIGSSEVICISSS